MKSHVIFFIWIIAIGLYCDPLSAQEATAGKQVEMSFTASDGVDVKYLLYLPEGYESGTEVPLIYFLHGRGESFGPLSLVAKWGPPRMAARGDKLPYMVVSPQCPKKDNWASDTQQKRLLELFNEIEKSYSIDKNRVFLTGLSMGGYGTWTMAARHPERFAAAVPICGGGVKADAEKLTDIPIWVFHGDQDKAVPFERSVEMVEAIRAAGGKKIRFTTLEDFGHNSWSAAYAHPDLYSWMERAAKK